MNRLPLIALGAAGLLAGFALLSSSSSPLLPERHVPAWSRKVIRRVALHEGSYTALNRNTDGAGLSVGILQWAQQPGQLGVLLRAMYASHPEAFAQAFGKGHSALLAHTEAGYLGPLEGAHLWHEPWVSRFRKALSNPRFQAVQDVLAAKGEHFRGALAAARILGVQTERSIALLFDTAVQQGPRHAQRVAKRVSDMYLGQPIPDATLLDTYARLTGAHFLRVTPPEGPHKRAPRLQWVQVSPGEWHVFAGRTEGRRGIDLYQDILKRRLGILKDAQLGDDFIEVPGAMV